MRSLASLAVFLVAVNAFAQEESWAGKVILTTRNDSVMVQFNAVGQKGLTTALDDSIYYRVIADKGTHLKVVNTQGQEGWLDKNEAVLLSTAVKHFTESIVANPRDAGAYQKRAFALEKEGNLDAAIRDLNQVIHLEFYDAAGYNHRGILHAAKKDYDQAFKDFAVAIRYDPKQPAAYCNRGNALLAQKQFGKAIESFTDAIRRDPKQSYLYQQRGIARFLAKQLDEALEDFDRSEKLEPNNPAGYLARARMLSTCGAKKYRDGKEAVRLAEKALKIDKTPTPESLEIVAAAYAEAGNFAEAIRYQGLAMQNRPNADQEEGRRRLNLYRNKAPLREE